MEAKARSKYIRMSSRKVAQVAEVLRDKSVGEVMNILKFSPKAAALPLMKTVQSAIANMVSVNPEVDVDDLHVSYIIVGNGPTMKRYRARAMGRAARIRRRTSHITVVVATGEDVASAKKKRK
jgi:large subunit ribosomal protein L22